MCGGGCCKTKHCSSSECPFIAFCWRSHIFSHGNYPGEKQRKTEVADENLDCVLMWIQERKCSLRPSFKCCRIWCPPSLRLEHLLCCVGIKCVPVSLVRPTRSQEPACTLLHEDDRVWPSSFFLGVLFSSFWGPWQRLLLCHTSLFC